MPPSNLSQFAQDFLRFCFGSLDFNPTQLLFNSIKMNISSHSISFLPWSLSRLLTSNVRPHIRFNWISRAACSTCRRLIISRLLLA